MGDLFEKARKMNRMLRESATGNLSFDDLCAELAEVLSGNVCVVDLKGIVLARCIEESLFTPAVFEKLKSFELIKKERNKYLLDVVETRANIPHEELTGKEPETELQKELMHSIFPVIGGNTRLGTLIVTRVGQPQLTEGEIILSEYGATAVALELMRKIASEKESEERERSMVRNALNTLSYSEKEALKHIVEALNNATEGLLVASKIADRTGITRSVIVNALRKLESPGVIEARSLGMKGTHIKVRNKKFMEEFEEFIK